MSQPERILLTGASGEIGTPLIARLAEQGHALHVISRRAPPPETSRTRWICADLTDPESLRRACRCEPRVVIHMAAVTHSRNPATYDAVNVRGTENLIEALSAAPPRRFIHMSTRAIGADGGAYAGSKERAEEAVRGSGLPFTILRPAEVYGSGGDDPILSLAADLRRRRFVPILGDGSHELCPVLASDVVDAVVELVRAIELDRGNGKTYVLAGPHSLTYLELVEKLETIQGIPRRWRISVPVAVARGLIGGLATLGVGSYVPDQVPRLLLHKPRDYSEAARDLQFTPRSIEEALPSLLKLAPRMA